MSVMKRSFVDPSIASLATLDPLLMSDAKHETGILRKTSPVSASKQKRICYITSCLLRTDHANYDEAMEPHRSDDHRVFGVWLHHSQAVKVTGEKKFRRWWREELHEQVRQSEQSLLSNWKITKFIAVICINGMKVLTYDNRVDSQWGHSLDLSFKAMELFYKKLRKSLS